MLDVGQCPDKARGGHGNEKRVYPKILKILRAGAHRIPWPAQVADLGAIQPLDSILESLAVEAYLQVLKDTW